MTEKRMVVSGVRLAYTGLFDLPELYAVFDRWLKQMGYDKKEQKHEVRVYEDSKILDLDIRPTKTVSDYVYYQMIIKFQASNLKDRVVEIDGKERKLQEGSLAITINGYVMTDWEDSWTSSALPYFFRTIIDKYIYAGYIKDFDSQLKDDINNLYT